MAASPYRHGEITGGVALPRRGLRIWTAASIAVAHLLIGLGVFVTLRAKSNDLFFGLLFVWIVALATLSGRLFQRPKPRPGVGLMLAITPIAYVELASVSSCGLPTSPRLAASSLANIANLQLIGYGAAAIGCAVLAVGGMAALLSIDWASSKKPEKPAWPLVGWGVLCAVAFAILRVHGTHRDALGGALGAVPLIAAGVFVGSSRVDLQACKLEYSIVSPK